MKKIILLGILALQFSFADTVKEVKPEVLEDAGTYMVFCIRDYEFLQDSNGTMSQIMQVSQYKLTGVDAIPISLPKPCDKKGYLTGKVIVKGN